MHPNPRAEQGYWSHALDHETTDYVSPDLQTGGDPNIQELHKTFFKPIEILHKQKRNGCTVPGLCRWKTWRVGTKLVLKDIFVNV